jgi:hypothetical protein
VPVVLAVAALVAGSARAGQDATFVLDRTYSCAIALHGGIYQLENRAHPGARVGRSWSKLAYAGLRAGVFSGGTGNLLAWISAGKPAQGTTVDQEFWTFDVKTFGTIGVSGRNCNPTTSPVLLSAAGLRGGGAASLGSELKCDVQRRVLVRIRAVLASRASLHGREFESVHVPVVEAKLAVRTVGGKPLAYATVSQSGKAKLFTAKGCVPE